MTLETILKQHPDMLASTIDSQTALLNMDAGKYFGFNSVGSRIWQLIEKPVAIREVCSVLAKEYNVQEDRCAKEVIDFCHKLLADNLAQVVDETAP